MNLQLFVFPSDEMQDPVYSIHNFVIMTSAIIVLGRQYYAKKSNDCQNQLWDSCTFVILSTYQCGSSGRCRSSHKSTEIILLCALYVKA